MTREELLKSIAITSGIAGVEMFKACEANNYDMINFIKWYKVNISFCSQVGKQIGTKVISSLEALKTNNNMEELIITKAIISDSKVIFKTNNNMNTVNNNTNNNTNNIKRRTKVRTIPLSLREAKQWYKGNNDTLKKLALRVYTEEELVDSFVDIKSFKDACDVLNIDYSDANYTANCVSKISKASAAMFKLNIIRKALNLGQDLNLTTDSKDSRIYYPFNPIMTTDATYYKKELKANKIEIIGNITNEGIPYKVLGGAFDCGYVGCFNSSIRIGFTDANFAFLGCATKEIAEHFSKYFGMLITEAKYGDLPNFKIVYRKYNI